MRVLFISMWYPNRYDAMLGLFVRKHALAVARYCQVEVLYIHPDPQISEIEIISNTFDELPEHVVYFPAPNHNVVQKFYKSIQYFKAYIRGISYIRQRGFKPDIVHANILTRTAVVALIHKLVYGVPYIITEHWSRFLPQNNSYKGTVRKALTHLCINGAGAVCPVSDKLQQAMIAHHLKHSNYQVVDNVVDSFFKYRPGAPRATKKLLHISCFDDQAKNISGMLRAIRPIMDIRTDFELTLVGTGVDAVKIQQYAEELNFPQQRLNFSGELSPEEVAAKLTDSDMLLHFSNYETAAVVIAESLSCGVPVLSTDVGIVSQYINETNGRIVNPGNESGFRRELAYMLDNLDKYNREQIAATHRQIFSFEYIGNKYLSIYQPLLTKK